MWRDYLAVLGLLALAFAVFFVISIFDDIKIGSFTLRSSSMAESVFGKSDDQTFKTVNDSALAPSASEAEEWPVVLDTIPKNVLIIGDSMLEGLSPRLAAYCDASGYDLYTAIWYSSTTELYGQTHLLADYIKAIRPGYIFLSLGGNELFVADVASKRLEHVKSILSDIGDTPFLWIGPPNWKPDTGINQLIRSNVPKGAYFPSHGLKFDRKRDGAHPTAESSAAWMDSIIRWMPANAAYVLPLRPPAADKARGKRIYIHPPGPLPQRPKPLTN